MALSAASRFSASPISFFICSHKTPHSIKRQLSSSTPYPSLNSAFYSLSALPTKKLPFQLFSALPTKKLPFQLFSAVQEIPVGEETQNETVGEETQIGNQEKEQRRKLFVFNLSWVSSAPEIRNLFGECGTVKDVEMIKKDGRSRGIAFVTMASAEEASAALEKFDSFEFQGRIIRVEFAKSMKKPSSPTPPGTPAAEETRHKIYVSNLPWKARSSHLREFFASSFNPVSCRVIFDSPSGRSAGYGFVSFANNEEVEAAISALDGKELMGRPLTLKISEKKVEKSREEPKEEDMKEADDGEAEVSEGQSQES